MRVTISSEDKQTLLITAVSISISLIILLPPLIVDLFLKLFEG